MFQKKEKKREQGDRRNTLHKTQNKHKVKKTKQNKVYPENNSNAPSGKKVNIHNLNTLRTAGQRDEKSKQNINKNGGRGGKGRGEGGGRKRPLKKQEKGSGDI